MDTKLINNDAENGVYFVVVVAAVVVFLVPIKTNARPNKAVTTPMVCKLVTSSLKKYIPMANALTVLNTFQIKLTDPTPWYFSDRYNKNGTMVP